MRPLRDPTYLEAVRRMPCLFEGGDCLGSVVTHHTGKRPGMGMKCSDEEAVPLCLQHHLDFHGLRGVFKGFDKEQLRTWSEAAIAKTRARFEDTREERMVVW